MIASCIILLAGFLSHGLADVQFTSPAPGDQIPGDSIQVVWKDSGIVPALSDLVSYQLFLCAGGSTADSYLCLAALVADGHFADGNSASTKFSIVLGANTTNTYFLKMISAAANGAVINYSDRFSLTSMIGDFSPVIVAELKGVAGTAGPPTENNVLSLVSSSSSPSRSSTTVSSTSTSTTVNSTTTAQSSSNLGAAAGAGIAIGIIIVLSALAIGIYAFIIRRRRAFPRSRFDESSSKPQLEDTSELVLMRNEKAPVSIAHELTTDGERYEVDSTGTIFELDGRKEMTPRVSAKELPS